MRRNLKKIKHKQHKDFLVRKRVSHKQDPMSIDIAEVMDDLAHDKLWQMPYIERDEFKGQDLPTSKQCNYERTENIKLSLNFHTHNDPKTRQKLKPLADKHQIVHWQGIVSNVAIDTSENIYKGYLLIDKVVNLTPDMTGIYMGFHNSLHNNLLDYHMWLPVDRILYFGDKEYQEIAQGECIRGYSYITPYTKQNGEISYGLGKTVIEDCGIVVGTAKLITAYGFKSTNSFVYSDYDREGNWMVKINYTPTYQMSLRRYKNKDLASLRFIHPNLYAAYRVGNQIGYQSRIDQIELPNFIKAAVNHEDIRVHIPDKKENKNADHKDEQ